MSRKIPNPSIARFAAAIAAALWAMLGLGNAYATGLGRGVDAFVIVAVIANVALIIAAALAFVNAQRWRVALIVAASVVTADPNPQRHRDESNGLTILSSAIVLVALVAMAHMASQR